MDLARKYTKKKLAFDRITLVTVPNIKPVARDGKEVAFYPQNKLTPKEQAICDLATD